MKKKERCCSSTPDEIQMEGLFLLFSYPFKWGAIHLVVHKSPSFRVSFNPEAGLGVLDLTSAFDGTVSMSVASW